MEFAKGKKILQHNGYEIEITSMEERNFYTIEIKELDYFDVSEGYEEGLGIAKEIIFQINEKKNS